MFNANLKSAVLLLLTTVASQAAHAWVYIGNPKLTVTVDRPQHDLLAADAVIEGVRVHRCGGGFDDYSVGASYDLVDGYGLDIEGGNLCGVSVDWSDELLVETPTASLSYDEPSTSVTLDGTDASWSLLTPFVVEEGTMSGAPPRMVVVIQ